MILALPVLRSPPFPGIAEDVAAVSKTVDGSSDSDRSAARVNALLAAIVDAKVGGAFWAPCPPLAAGPYRLWSPADAAMARAFAGKVADGDVILLPRQLASLAPLFGVGQVIVGEADPWSLLAGAAEVHASGDDELIFLALAAGIGAHCAAAGRYAGWGLTTDDTAVDRRETRGLTEIAADRLLAHAEYRDCFTGQGTSAEAAVFQLGAWRRQLETNRGIATAIGVARWKRKEVARMLWDGSTRPLRFTRTTAGALRHTKPSEAIAAWPSRMPRNLMASAAERQVTVRLIEDGFVRSVGLGSNLHPPLSIVSDARGIYYDPTRPSDLEHLLATASFGPALLERAAALIHFIVAEGVSKYMGAGGRVDAGPDGQRRVLVTGQVEDDLSVRLGGGGIEGNLDLLRRARAAEPDAFILFKPHPDVDAGHRAGRIEDAEALCYADRVVRDVSMPALFPAIDAIHVWTSLAGFEALLRGREVVTHGGPFYAGWGLTKDLGPALPRRNRFLTIEELTAGALIVYPFYLDPVTHLPCSPETLMGRLVRQDAPRRTWLIRGRQLQGWLRRAMRPVGTRT